MIALEKACEIFLSTYEEEKPYIIGIKDLGDYYAFTKSWNPDEVSTDDGVGVVSKISGEIKWYAYAQIVGQMINGKKVIIPEKYSYKKV